MISFNFAYSKLEYNKVFFRRKKKRNIPKNFSIHLLHFLYFKRMQWQIDCKILCLIKLFSFKLTRSFSNIFWLFEHKLLLELTNGKTACFFRIWIAFKFRFSKQFVNCALNWVWSVVVNSSGLYSLIHYPEILKSEHTIIVVKTYLYATRG